MHGTSMQLLGPAAERLGWGKMVPLAWRQNRRVGLASGFTFCYHLMRFEKVKYAVIIRHDNSL